MRAIASRLPPLGLIALVLALAFASAANASSRQAVTFEAPRDLLNPATREATMAQLDSLGVRALRIVLYWQDVAPNPDSRIRPQFDPTDPKSYNWSKYAPVLDEARARGWKVLLTISGPIPLWASNGATNHTYMPRPSEFGSFVIAVSRRFGSGVWRYSIYNEPNHPKFLTPQYDRRGNVVSPRLYRALYVSALQGLSTAGDTHPVLMGETAPHGSDIVVAPLVFLRGALCLDEHYVLDRGCGPLRVDGWAIHPYTRNSPYYIPRNLGDHSIRVLPRVIRALDRAAKAGALPPDLPLYLTEFGMQSLPDTVFGVTLQRQAEYRAISEQIAWKEPRVASFSQYLLRDDLPRKGKTELERFGGFETGLRSSAGRIKPAFAGFRLPLVVTRGGSRAALWGLIRPPDGPREVVVQVRDHGRSWRELERIKTDELGAWQAAGSYRRGREWRVLWTDAAGRPFAGPATRAYKPVTMDPKPKRKAKAKKRR